MAPPTAPLAALLAGKKLPLDGDEILSQFVGYVAETGLDLYPAQEEALLELVGGKHIILNTPTGSGKSLVATAMHFKAMAEGNLADEFEGPDGRVHWRDSRLEWPVRHGFVDFIAREFHAGKMMFPPDAS